MTSSQIKPLPLRSLLRSLIVKCVVSSCALFVSTTPSLALNNYYSPSLTTSQIIQYLNSPINATHAVYNITDSAGNSMQVPSILQLSGQSYSYAAVYHTPYTVSNGIRFKVNLAASNDLVHWTYIRTLVDNADGAKILRVSNSNWIMITNEQWSGPGPASSSPCSVSLSLFYNDADLLAGTIRSNWIMPNWQNNLNGTPSIYNATMQQNNQGNYVVNGQYGFHFYNGSTDMNGVTTIGNLFNPAGGTTNAPSTASTYNSDFTNMGATAVGNRDTLQTASARFNLQEVHTGASGTDWDKWRVWLYQFNDGASYPTGYGSITQLAPQTPNGSVSFGSPIISVVNSPSGSGHSLVVSYFLFTPGAGANEAGPLLFYYDIP